MIRLVDVYDVDQRYDMLYCLLEERTKEQSISHKEMPEWADHLTFVDSKPYMCWYFILDDYIGIVGSIYLTQNREIGISIFKTNQRQGYARGAIMALRKKYPGKMLANINPQNTASINMFKSLGAVHIQETYAL